MNGIAYLSVGTEQRRDANFTTEIGLRSTVFAPVETACGHIAAEPCEDRPVRHRFHTSAPPFCTNVSWPGRSGNQ